MTVASDPPRARSGKRPNRLFKNWMAKLASLPMILTALVVFVGGTAWTVTYSFTGSRMLPKTNWVGFDQSRTLLFMASVR
jgi:glucose/mannose transport system permease protein